MSIKPKTILLAILDSAYIMICSALQGLSKTKLIYISCATGLITKTILEASKTIDYISSVTVLEQKAKIDGNKIIEYYSTIDLTFSVDENRI